jgi:hypothetical protein
VIPKRGWQWSASTWRPSGHNHIATRRNFHFEVAAFGWQIGKFSSTPLQNLTVAVKYVYEPLNLVVNATWITNFGDPDV